MLITVLVVLPSVGGLLTVISFALNQYYHLSTSLGPRSITTTPSSFLEAWIGSGYIGYVGIYAGFYFYVALIYGLRSLGFKTEEDFKKRGFGVVANEFEILKKILIIMIPILGVSTILWFLLPASIRLSYFTVLYTLTYSIVIGAGLRFATQIVRKDFWFYCCKGYITIMNETENQLEKMKYFRLALKSYDKYLKRLTGFRINSIDRACSRFILSDIEGKNVILESVCSSVQHDKIELSRYLSKLTNVPEAEILAEETLKPKLKSIGAVLAVIVPVTISTIELIRHFSSTGQP
jgi:hypothetical protein